MRARLEPTAFVLTLLLLGWWSYDLVRPRPTARTRDASAEAELERHAAPPVELALRAEGRLPRAERDLFSPPRDTRPLPPLDPVEPPFPPLPALLPPTVPGPAPRAYGALLRTRLVVQETPGLFDEAEDTETSDEDLAFLEQAGARPAEPRSLIPALRDARDAPDPFANESAEERLARYESYRDRYDWILRFDGATPTFGRIENEDRYRLLFDEQRASEPLLFTEIDPETGRNVYERVGGRPIPYDRSQVHEFHFARTFANELEIERLRIGDELTRGSYEEALDLARRCVLRRHEAPRALDVARELFELCRDYDPEDLAPRLGLGACHEAAFRFEEAFEVYRALVAEYPHRPESHVRLGLLEERFLLHESAEERLRRAVAVDRGSFEARFALGAFLQRRGRSQEAVEELEQANRLAPQDPESLALRVAVRDALADAHFATGALDEARRLYQQAASADADDAHAQAGILATGLFGDGLAAGGDGPVSPAGEGTTSSFELLLVRGVAALRAGDFTDARDSLRLATEVDPLRAYRARDALSYLADETGHPEEALGFVEAALEAAPADAWSLYQRGRLLAQRDEYEAARSSLLAALESELEFEDALVALGDAAFRLGRFEDAERFFERAAGLTKGRADVHALRGWNFLRLGSVPDARASFERALEVDAREPLSLGGLAWCSYLGGDAQEALIRLADLDESRRSQPEDDPYRAWARAQIERISEHQSKVAWVDDFERTVLRNGWQVDERAGPTASMVDGTLRLEGVFEENGTCQVRRDYPANLFVSFQARLLIDPRSNARAGIALVRERQRRNSEPEVLTEASVSRHKDGGLQVRIVGSGKAPQDIDMQQGLPAGEWVTLRIERTGEASSSRVTLFLDGIPLVENVALAGLGTGSSTPLFVGLFVEGETGRQVSVRMDDVEVVYRQ